MRVFVFLSITFWHENEVTVETLMGFEHVVYLFGKSVAVWCYFPLVTGVGLLRWCVCSFNR